LICITQGLDSRSTLNRGFQFQKRSQLFIRTHNETLSIIAMCVSNPDCSAVAIQRSDATSTPSGFAEIVSDDFPNTSRAADLRLLFHAEFLESGIGAQRIPKRIEP
jgi:hypothetical protein